VFGSAGVRRRAYERELPALRRAVTSLGATEIVDIGPGAIAPPAIGGLAVRVLGPLPEDAVSAELLRARFGFVSYPPDFLDKSTIFAAYLAHGMLPVCAWSGLRGRAPRDDEFWVRATPKRIETRCAPESLAARGFAAYSSRSLARHAEFWQRRLQAS
jgi:hypothetical protein